MRAFLQPRTVPTAFASIRNTKALTNPIFAMNYSTIKTPERCYADFCLIPVGTGSLSVAKEVAEVQRLLKASGLKYTMHSAGTTVGKSGVPPSPAHPRLHKLTPGQKAAGTRSSKSSARRTRSCIRPAR